MVLLAVVLASISWWPFFGQFIFCCWTLKKGKTVFRHKSVLS
jgi:hypothetical protein